MSLPIRLTISTVLLGASLLVGVTARAQGKDILCVTTNVRHDIPGLCQQSCPARRTSVMQCALSPQCPALKGEPNLKRFYNAAIFQTLGVVPPKAKEVVVAHIINRFYKPAHAGLFDIGISGTISGYAEVGNRKNANGKYALTLHPDLYWMSPPMLAGTVGHEMVHYFQYQRASTVNLANLDTADTVFREIEASAWETGATGYTWPHGTNRFFGCVLTQAPRNERQAVLDLLACRNWQAKKVIENLRNSPRAGLLDRLQKYLEDNPYTKAVWLPANPGWRTYTAGFKPDNCL